jgi:hypothetical protein
LTELVETIRQYEKRRWSRKNFRSYSKSKLNWKRR